MTRLIDVSVYLINTRNMKLCIMKNQQSDSLLEEQSESSPQHIQFDTISHMIKEAYKASTQELELQIKLRHIQPINEEKIQRKGHQPSYREAKQILQTLREKMGDKDIQKIIKILYNNLVKAKASKLRNSQKDKKLKCWQDLLQQKSIQIPPIASKQYIIRPLIRQKKIIRKEDEQRYLQKKIVARAFTNRDYGLAHLQEQIFLSKSLVVIKRQRYTDLAYATVTEGYRLLEHFLLHECKRNIKPVDKYQMGALHRVLCNCRLLLKPEDSLTFLKFVRIAFSIESVSVTEEAAVRLYINLQKTIKSRVGNRQLDCSIQKKQWTKYVGMQRRRQFKRQEFQAFLTPAIEKEIIKAYLRLQMVSKVKGYLIDKYADKKHLFTLQSVSGIICKIVRITIKRICYYKQRYKDAGLPDLLQLDSSYRCKISKAGEALKARKLILKLWKSKQQKILKRLPKVINEINKFIEMKDQEKTKYVISKTKPNHNVIEKIEFNINVSRTKLTEGFKTKSQDEVILKSTENDFQHYINSENGKKLHYYRKLRQKFEEISEDEDRIKIDEDRIKIEEQQGMLRVQNQSSDSDSDQSSQNQSDSVLKMQENPRQNDSQLIDKQNQSDHNQTQLMIKQWIERLNLQFFKFY